MKHFQQINRKFAKIWPCYIGFYLQSDFLHVDVLLTIYEQQTMMEKRQGDSLFANSLGFAKGIHAQRFSRLAERLLKGRTEGKTMELSSLDKRELAPLFRYFPQYIEILERQKGTAIQFVRQEHSVYLRECKKLNEEMKDHAANYPDDAERIEGWAKSLQSHGMCRAIREKFEALQRNPMRQIELF